MIEKLENRLLLSAALGEDLDIVITGGASDDNVAVVAEGNTIIVSEGGLLSFFDRAQQHIFNVRIRSGDGNDRIRISGDLFATVWAGRGDDWISSGSGNDILYGGRGNDTIFGNDGIDVLTGRSGRDVLKGGAGDDILDGFDGRRDILIGGDGTDFGRVDRALEFARSVERRLRIDPNVASFHQHSSAGEEPVLIPYPGGNPPVLVFRPWQTGGGSVGGMVTVSDFIDLASNFNSGGGTWQDGDLNGDGSVSIDDFIDLAANFSTGYGV